MKEHEEEVARMVERNALLQGRAEAAEAQARQFHAEAMAAGDSQRGALEAFESLRALTIDTLEEAIRIFYRRPADAEAKLIELRDKLKPIVKVDP